MLTEEEERRVTSVRDRQVQALQGGEKEAFLAVISHGCCLLRLYSMLDTFRVPIHPAGRSSSSMPFGLHGSTSIVLLYLVSGVSLAGLRRSK